MQPHMEELIKKHLGENKPDPKVLNLLTELEQRVSSDQGISNDLMYMLDSMPFGITLIDKNKHIVHANRDALELMGYDSLDELVGHICNDTLCPADKDKCPILDLKQSVDRSDRILISKDKRRIPILKSVVPIVYQGEEVLLEAFIDITEKTEIEKVRAEAFEKRGELATNVNQILRHLAQVDQVDELMASLTEEMHRVFGFSRVQYYTYNPVANNLRLTEVAGDMTDLPAAQKSILPIKQGAAGKAANQHTIYQAVDSDFILGNYEHMLVPGIKAQVALPIFSGTDLVGVLDVQETREGSLDGDTILFLETLSFQGGILLDNLQKQADMMEKFEEVNSIQRKASMEGWQDFKDIYHFAAPKYKFDMAQNEAVPLNDEEFSSTSMLSKPLEVRGTVIGSMGITEDPDQPLTEEEQELIESVSSEVAEALERARLFESSQRSASELAVLNEMGATFAQALTEEFINETIYNYTVKLMEAPQFFIAHHEPEEDMIFFPLVMINGKRITEDHPDYDNWAPRPAGSGLTGYMIQNRMPILIDSNAEETLNQLGLPYLQTGKSTQSFLGVPMLIGDRALGVISVQSETTPDLYGRHNLDLLTTIASQAAVAINNTRLFQSEQDRALQERTVRTITDKVRRGTDTRAIMRIALEELSQVLNADMSTIQLGKPEEIMQEESEPALDEEITEG